MKKSLALGLSALMLSLAAAPAVYAQAPLSVDTTPIETLAANPAAKAVVEQTIPVLFTHEAYDQFKTMTLKALQPLSQGQITDEMLATVQAALAAIK